MRTTHPITIFNGTAWGIGEAQKMKEPGVGVPVKKKVCDISHYLSAISDKLTTNKQYNGEGDWIQGYRFFASESCK